MVSKGCGERRSEIDETFSKMYVGRAKVERNYSKVLEMLIFGSKQQLYSVYKGMGVFLPEGYGI